MREDGEINWRTDAATRTLQTLRVTDNLFAVAGIPVAAGRGIQKGDEDVAVISHAAWQVKLAGDAAVIGRVLVLDNRPHRIVGVLPENHRTLVGFGFTADAYLPVRSELSHVMLMARSGAGEGPGAMQDRVKAAARRLDEEMPRTDGRRAEGNRVEQIAGWRHLMGSNMIGVTSFFLVLMAMAGLVLLIACINVSNLALARGAARRQEFAIRGSLGAGRGRLVRQLLTESMLVALAGTAAGLLVNLAATRALNTIDLDLPVMLVLRIAPDWRLLAYASLVAAGCALAVGLLPAWRLARNELGGDLKERTRLRRGLVVAQVAVSLVVLVTAGLFARNLRQSLRADPGFDLARTLYVKARLVPESYGGLAGKVAAARRMEAELQATPGVVRVARTAMLPLNDDASWRGTVERDGDGAKLSIRYHRARVGEDYFATMGVPVLAGREFSGNEFEGRQPGGSELAARGGARVAVVNEAFARQVFGVPHPVGRAFRHGTGAWFTVVGVARNAKYAYLFERDRPAVFEPHEVTLGEGRGEFLYWMVRAQGDPAGLVETVRTRLQRLDASAALEVRPMRQALSMAFLPSQVGGLLFGSMGALGLFLTALGVYGVLAYGVAQRTREIGVRMALGASPGWILRLVLGSGAALIAVGLGVGLVVAYFVTRPLASFLIEGVTPGDGWAWAAAVLVLFLAGLAACLAPARRAMRVEPTVALRYE